MLYYTIMLKITPRQSEFEFVCLEQLIPQDHLLRKIDGIIDFGFIREEVKHLYSENNGRPGLDPVVMFKILFIGYLYGVRSERQLMREIDMNLAYRWFLGYNITEKIPDHSTISQNRRRRFQDSDVYRKIFDRIVERAMELNLADGKHLYSDSTHLKANANKNKFDLKDVQKSAKDYLDALDSDINEDRLEHGKRELKKKAHVPEIKETKVSKVDPESGYMVRDGKPEGFFYLDHRTVDGKFNIITDTYVTPGNVHDSIPYLKRLDYQIKHFNFNVKSVGLDAGYFTAPICKGLVERDIFGVIAYHRMNHIDGYFYKRKYRYNAEQECYVCPAGQQLHYQNTTAEGYQEFVSDPKICRNCQFLSQCTKSRNHKKILTRHVWEKYKEQITENRYSEYGKKIFARRKETIERSFADAKQLHGYRYARFRGLKKVTEQCLLTAACQNLKKIALAA